jgi:hypothetical protein
MTIITSVRTVCLALETVQVKLSLEALVRFLLEKLGDDLLHKTLRIVNLEVLTIWEPRNNGCITSLLDRLQHLVKSPREWNHVTKPRSRNYPNGALRFVILSLIEI